MSSIINAFFKVGTFYLGEFKGISFLKLQDKHNKIRENVQKKDLINLQYSFNEFGEEIGRIEIASYNENLQLHFFLNSENERKELIDVLSSYSADWFTEFENWQIPQEEGVFALKLMTNQSVAFLGGDPTKLEIFEEGQELLKNIQKFFQEEAKKKEFPLLQLTTDTLLDICNFLPLKDLCEFTRTNRQISQLLSYDNKAASILFAKSLNVHFDPTKHTNFNDCLVIDSSFGTVNIKNYTLTMKISQQAKGAEEFFEEVFNKYVPKDYYLDHYYYYGAHKIFYRNENDEVRHLFTPGRQGKENFLLDEQEIYDKIKSEMKPFTLIPIEKER